MVSNVLVLGGGSAGFLAAISLKHRLPRLTVTIVRSPEIGIIGVGEGTTVGVPQYLHYYLGISPADFYRIAEPQWKLGIRFLWGKRPYFDYPFAFQLDTKYNQLSKGTGFYCGEGSFDYVGVATGLMSHNNVFVRHPNGHPLIGGEVAYHIENELFVRFLETLAVKLGVIIHNDTIVEVKQDDHGIAGLRLASGVEMNADLYMDCSGYASVLLGKALQEPFVSFKNTLFNDRAVVGGWTRTHEPIKPYTTAETMSAGWCWQIDHEHRINRGYVYSSSFISDADADAEFRAANPLVTQTRIVKFLSGRYERGWVKNVVGIGNSSGFVEPLESTSLAAICAQSQAVAEALADCDDPGPAMIGQYNKRTARNWESIRRFLGLHFKFNMRYDTPYWQACRADADISEAAEVVAYYQENGPSVVFRSSLLAADDQFGMEGYLSLLVGQQVPHRSTYRPTAAELNIWSQLKKKIQIVASSAVSVREALATIRAPNFAWHDRNFYQLPRAPG